MKAMPGSWMDVVPVRPSSLPKLAACPCFASSPGTSEAAERGTLLDGVIRDAIATGDTGFRQKLVREDVDAVEWAVAKVRLMAMGCEVFTDDARCAVASVDERVASGTMDAVCPELCWLVDYKTGQLRDYRGQMAAYALGCMEAFWAEEWTAHLLFVDQREVVTHRFTREEAERCVEEVFARPMEPSSCEYCSWCGRFECCPLVEERAEGALALVPAAPAGKAELEAAVVSLVERLKADAELAAEFDERAEVVAAVKERLREFYKADMAAKGERKRGRFSLSSCAGRKSVTPEWVGRFIQEMGFGPVLTAYGALAEKKVRELWEKTFPGKPFPEEALQQAPGYSMLRLNKKK